MFGGRRAKGHFSQAESCTQLTQHLPVSICFRESSQERQNAAEKL